MIDLETAMKPCASDAAVESSETIRPTLSSISTLSNISAGATLFKHIGTGTITNDD